jgi:WD40 repeat protein
MMIVTTLGARVPWNAPLSGETIMLPRMLVSSTVLMLAVALTPADAQQPAKARLDSAGDPLPAGAVARLGTLRFKHTPIQDGPLRFVKASKATFLNAQVSTAVFSPDGTRVASVASPNNSIRLWETASGKEIAGPWNAASSAFFAYALAFSPDGAVLAASGRSIDQGGLDANYSILWDIAGAKVVRTLEVPERNLAAQGMIFSDGGKTIACGDFSGTVHWWEVATGKHLRTWQAPPAKKQNEKGADNNIQVIYQNDPAIGPTVLALRTTKYELQNRPGYRQAELELTIYDIRADKEPGRVVHHVSTKAEAEAFTVAFSADGSRFAMLAPSGAVELRDAMNGKLLAVIAIGTATKRGSIANMSLSADGKQLAISTAQSKITLWSQANPDAFREIDLHAQAPARCIAFSADAKRLVTGVGIDVRVYDLDTLKETRAWVGHRQPVGSVAFSADGRTFETSTTRDGALYAEHFTWNLARWEPSRSSFGAGPTSLSVGVVSPDHSVFAGGGGNRFNLYQASSGNLLASLNPALAWGFSGVGFFSQDSRFYVLEGKNDAGKDAYLIYSVPTGKRICELPIPVPSARAKLANATMSMRNAPTGAPVVLSADGGVAAMLALDDGRICVWDTAAGSITHRLGSPVAKEDVATFRQLQDSQLGMSPDGKWLASWTGRDRQVRVWNLTSGAERRAFPRDGDVASAVRFAWSPDGRILAVARRQTVQLWEMASMRLRSELKGHNGDVLALAFSPDGKYLASGAADTTVLVWDARGP